jgi:hypothetical protein
METLEPMGKSIIGREQYNEAFCDPERRAGAFDRALDIRKFEIDLYWKRATYFWTLITATFAGYFALAASDKDYLLFMIACIGLVLSTSWYLVNRGSKYWQEHWERHVDTLEDECVGPLYKTTIATEEFCIWRLHDAYPYSVSKINQLTSLFVTFVWLILLVSSLLSLALFALSPSGGSVPSYVADARTFLVIVTTMILLVITVFFIVVLLTLGRSREPGGPRKVNFRKSKLG